MLEQRFWDKVSKTSSCWFFTGAKRDGYGMYSVDGKNKSAHRLTYAETKGEIPEDREVDHICMNRNCVNPEHLELVDRTENLKRGSNSAKYPSRETNSKSFLLYIHEPRFREEKKKSELVNNLLERHYHDTVDGGKTQEQVHAGIKAQQDALFSAKVPEEDRYVQTPDGILGPTKLTPRAVKFCKNNHPIPNGRNKCLGKGCKYA